MHVKWEIYTQEYIEEHMGQLNWLLLSVNPNFLTFSYVFIRKYENFWDWRVISLIQPVNIEFISEFADKFDWKLISKYQPLTKEIVIAFQNRVYWSEIIMNNRIKNSTKALLILESSEEFLIA